MSERGTLSLSMPNSACSSSVIARRRRFTHVGDQQHVGAVARRARTSRRRPRAAPRARTAGRLSRYLTLRLSVFCIVGERGSPRIERLPSARGPNSMRPWNQPTALPSASARAVRVDQLVVVEHRRTRAPAAVSRRSMSSCVEGRAEIGALHAIESPFEPARLAELQVIGGERRAERAAGVARRRLDPDVARSCRRAGPCRWRRS